MNKDQIYGMLVSFGNKTLILSYFNFLLMQSIIRQLGAIIRSIAFALFIVTYQWIHLNINISSRKALHTIYDYIWVCSWCVYGRGHYIDSRQYGLSLCFVYTY